MCKEIEIVLFTIDVREWQDRYEDLIAGWLVCVAILNSYRYLQSIGDKVVVGQTHALRPPSRAARIWKCCKSCLRVDFGRLEGRYS